MRFLVLLLLCTSVCAQEYYQADEYGNIEYHEDHLVKDGNEVYREDAYGKRDWSKTWEVKDDQAIQKDAYGKREYHEKRFVKK